MLPHELPSASPAVKATRHLARGQHHRMVGRPEAARRFHELAVRDALGEATPVEILKLNRYQALLRYKPSAGERREWEIMMWNVTRAMKLLRKLEHEAARSPNAEASQRREKS